MPCFFRFATKFWKNSSPTTLPSVTTKGFLRLLFFKCSGSSWMHPTPKQIRVGKLKVYDLLIFITFYGQFLNDFKISFHFPVRHVAGKLPPFPFPRFGEMIYKISPK